MNPTQLYYSSQWQVVEQRIDTGTLALHTQYVWSPVYVDAMVMRDSDFTGDASFTANERTYVMQDANFNVTGLVNLTSITGDRNEIADSPYPCKTPLAPEGNPSGDPGEPLRQRVRARRPMPISYAPYLPHPHF